MTHDEFTELCSVKNKLHTIYSVHITTLEVMDQIMGVTLAIGSLNYLLANMMSDSFGPSTAPFFWLIFFLQFVFVVRIQPRKADWNLV